MGVHPVQQFDRGKEFEDKIAAILVPQGWKRNWRTPHPEGMGQAPYDFYNAASDTALEVTLNADDTNIKALAFKLMCLTESGTTCAIIAPIGAVSATLVSMLLRYGRCMLFSNDDLEKALSIVSHPQYTGYPEYISSFREKSGKNYSGLDEHLKWFKEKSELGSSGRGNPHSIVASASEQDDSKKIPEQIAALIAGNFKERHQLIAEKVISSMAYRGYLASSTAMWEQFGVSKGVFYETILKKLKMLGLIRKHGGMYYLDSAFSLRNIRQAAEWIQFARITKNQPKELARVILAFFNLENE